MKTKTCPICNTEKSIDDFYKYFSKVRQKYRISNYCIPCGRKAGNKRAKEHYGKNREERIIYARKYFLKNYDIQLQQCRNSSRKRRKDLADSYIRDLMVQKFNFKNQYLLENPELVRLYKNKILIKRTLKKLKNGKEQTERPQ